METQLTAQQQASMMYRAKHESRRRGKMYHKAHGGTGRAADFDAAIAEAQANPEAMQLLEQMERQARQAASDAAADEKAEETARRAEIIRAAALGRWSKLAHMTIEEAREQPISESRSEAEEGVIGTYYHLVDEDTLAAALPAEMASVYFDPDDLDETFSQILPAVSSALEECALQIGKQQLRERATVGGRYSVFEYYRKTMTPDGSCDDLSFDDREDAELWLALLGDFSTSSYSATIVDNEEADNE